MIGILSRGILKIPHLAALLGEEVLSLRSGGSPRGVTSIAGWGMRPSARVARDYAERHQLPYRTLEDGFLRSLYLGNVDPPLSILVDDLGVHLDATRPSRLEELIKAPLMPEEMARACELIRLWQEARVSKYNYQRDSHANPGEFVLVVDQTLGDASISCGMANLKTFTEMLEAAYEENPDSSIRLRIHPGVLAGRKKGHFDLNKVRKMPRTTI